MAVHDLEKQMAAAVELTRTNATDDFLALYAYGSSVRADADESSDLDLCIVLRSSDTAIASLRSWAVRMEEAFGSRADAAGLFTSNMGDDATWDVSFLLHALRANSRLLVGEDVRYLIGKPSEHKTQINVALVALATLRRLYSLDFENELPERLPRLDISHVNSDSPHGAAWQVYSCVMQNLRAILYLESGVFAESRVDICQQLEGCDEPFLIGLVSKTVELRAKAPRFDRSGDASDVAASLLDCVPDLASRTRDAMDKHRLRDPSFMCGKWYAPDGSPLF